MSNLNPTIDSIWLLYINDWQNCSFRSPQFDIGMEGGTENSDDVHLSVLHFICSTLKCAYITLFHSTCQQTVLHRVCSTESPFDPPMQSVTYECCNI